MKESELVKQILDYLSLRRVWAYRTNTGALRNPQGRPVRFNVPGHPDIVARLRTGKKNAKVVWIEAKGKGGKLSPEQEEWQAKAKAHGDIFIVARCLEDVMGVFE